MNLPSLHLDLLSEYSCFQVVVVWKLKEKQEYIHDSQTYNNRMQEGNLSHSHLRDDPARQVSPDFVVASANGFGLSLMAIRTSQTRITPFDDADATKYGSSTETVLSFLVSTTPFKREEWASSMQNATFLLFVSHAVIFRPSPPVYRTPFCQYWTNLRN